MKRVLLIDDSQRILRITAQLLKLNGFEVLEAETGRRGLELAQQLHDIILCDITLPDIPGFEVLSTLHESAATAAIPFVFFTAENQKETINRGLNLGAMAFLNKPFTVEELLEIV